MSLGVSCLLTCGSAFAGLIADENMKAGISGDWPASQDGSAAGMGVVDAYPAQWSISPGDVVHLKVRSTTGYGVRVFRLGWYGGTGAHEMTFLDGQPADAQPYPTVDPTYGIAEAKWHDSLTIPTDATWTPGIYVARIERSDGLSAVTFWIVRDDKLPAKLPLLAIVATGTHEAYNCWPGFTRGGKSLYPFNSSTWIPTQSTDPSAVEVSYDRPFFVGGGSADVSTQEYPAIRFLERNGWDVAVATDQDVHQNPDILKGRKAVIVLGHPEYWTMNEFQGALDARDSGVHFLFLSGNTVGWQVRYQAGSGGPLSTEVGYKNHFPKDPEQKAGVAAVNAGDIEGAKLHFRYVTRGFRQLEYDPVHGIDERRPGMILAGVQSTAMINSGFPWGDLQITNPTHWLFEGTGVKSGDRIKGVMGYETDSTKLDDPTWDPFRPPNQVRLGTIRQTSDDSAQGSAGAYWKDLGGGKRVEVVAIGAISFSWALDKYAAGGADSESPVAQKMVTNALTRWTAAQLPTDPGSGTDTNKNPDPMSDGGTIDQYGDGGVPGDQATGSANAATSPASSGGSCGMGASKTAGAAAALATIAAALSLATRRRRW
jgi:hypothetical protein